MKPAALAIAIGLVATGVAHAQYDLSWYSIDGGGAMRTTGGNFELSGTIGQPDAGRLSGGNFELVGGFWGVAATVPASCGDLNCDGMVNNFDIDPFVIAISNPGLYATLYPGCNPLNGDCDGNGVLNNFDIDPFVQRLAGGP